MTQVEFKNCFDKYFDSIRNFIYYRSGDKELATDIAQEVFMKIWEKRDKLGIDNKGLLYKMASDLFISKLRRTKSELEYQQNFQFDYANASTEEDLDFNELKEKYEKALTRLPEKQRTVFLMSRNDSLKYHEIAEALKISTKAVEKRMKNALAFLKSEIKER